ncbi:hypothetical protein [Alkalimarinus coralli]|uniref:hypothetical protein n=1 Tax=Alkalimarinus coralli TaxID=2935863 RepID=UPI00202B50A3|nr:hypothetical protein [Alkalimarinus coralli]
MANSACGFNSRSLARLIYFALFGIITMHALTGRALASELEVGKVCPVAYQGHEVGNLVVSRPWYHSSRLDAAYTAMDNATGIGVEIHFFSNVAGDTRHQNIAECDRFRLLQTRDSTARLVPGEKTSQLDIPSVFDEPFSDNSPLEHGRGTHLTPHDDRDKPWQGRVSRSSTVALYDTPYVSDGFGVEGEDIAVKFHTCVVCEREVGFDNVLSCVDWGYRREYMGGMTGWAEPDLLPMQCQLTAPQTLEETLDNDNQVSYQHWLNWR